MPQERLEDPCKMAARPIIVRNNFRVGFGHYMAQMRHLECENKWTFCAVIYAKPKVLGLSADQENGKWGKEERRNSSARQSGSALRTQ